MGYYLAKQNLYQVGEETFNPGLSKMGFQYNKSHKNWYRVIDNKIIQFIGLKRRSGGVYDLEFACQPISMPLCMGWFFDNNGAVPCFRRFDADVRLDYMAELSLIDESVYPRIGGWFKDDPSDVRKHMSMTFENIVRPVLERAVTVEGCYDEYLDYRKLCELSPKNLLRTERVRKSAQLIDDFEIMCLLEMKRYDVLLQELRKSREICKEYDIRGSFEKYAGLIEHNNIEAIDFILEDRYYRNIEILVNSGFTWRRV